MSRVPTQQLRCEGGFGKTGSAPGRPLGPGQGVYPAPVFAGESNLRPTRTGKGNKNQGIGVTPSTIFIGVVQFPRTRSPVGRITPTLTARPTSIAARSNSSRLWYWTFADM